ncbi:hypothetical protein ACKA06_14720 [Rossellomorea oryzaecorticis]|uniref:DUF3953 domain-containing protein n=1 Tax=Rossellomorea oryzaecorticis TaxID=1396505 RepID=A0ABW8VTX8_9BACI
MRLLRKVNLVLALLGIGLGFTHFFIKGVQVPLYVSFAYLSIIFLLWGIQQVKDKQLKSGYFYIVVAVFMSMSLIW